MLRLEDIRIAQGDFSLTANFTLPEAGIVAVIGPSGAGKSTLLAVISGFFAPVAGRLVWQGDDLLDVAPGKRPVSSLFQDSNLFPHLTVEQNLGLALSKRARLSDQEKAQITDVLARVDLAGMEERLPSELSGGQQSRAALARVLLAKRPVVLLDEPFAALGPALKAEMLELMAEQLRAMDALVLLVTHDPDDARAVADQVIVVAEGQAYAPQPLTVLDNPPAALRDYLGSNT